MNAATVLLALVAFLTGAIVALQPGINSLLSRRLDHPIQASVVSFTAGWAAMVASCLLLRQRLPTPAMLIGAPWWMWVGGGLIGSFFVTTALIVAPKIGAAWWVALIVAGQMATSIALDHYGVLGFTRNELSAGRGFGAALVVLGVILIARN